MDLSEIKTLVTDQNTVLAALHIKFDEQDKKYDSINLEAIEKMKTELLDLQEYKQKTDRILAARGMIGEDKPVNKDAEEYSALFTKFMRLGDERMNHKDRERLEDLNKKSLSVNIDTDGGFTVTPEMSTKIGTRIFETSPVRPIATVQSIGSDSLDVMLDDDEAISGGWASEKEEVDETDTPKIGKLNIPVHEQFAQPIATQKILDDSGIDIENWLAGKVSRKITRVENLAFVSGDGVGKPKGFLSYDDWAVPSTGTVRGVYERNALETINSGTAGAFESDTLIRLQNSLIEDYQSAAVWLGNRHTIGELLQLKDSEARYRLLTFLEGGNMMLLGKPIIFANDMPTIADDATVLSYGDFGEGYQIVDRLGIRVLRDPFTSKPFIKFYTTKRTGGAVINFEAIKRYKLSI